MNTKKDLSLNLAKAFGHIVHKWRIARSISQEELAEICELDRTFISMLENGKRQPSLQTVFTISQALKVSPEELVRQTERQIALSNKKQRRSILNHKRL